MNRNDLLLQRLIEYVHSDVYPFHMPGHKRKISDFPDPFMIDITEIEGFDNLHHPEGILKKSMEWAASVYGSDRTWYLVNGSSCGILSAICASVRPEGKILMSRNCHKSAYHGVILNRIKTEYIYPQIIKKMWINGGISPKDVEKQLSAHPDIEAVLIVSPTYEGIVSDIKEIAEIVHRRKIPLIVDEAHGAHFSFSLKNKDLSQSSFFPISALDCGADIVIQSLHKTLSSLTQTAVLHAKKGFVNMDRLERYLQIFQSSSPSYVFMASIEQCIFDMEQKGADYMPEFENRIRLMRKELTKLKNISILDRSFCGKDEIFDVDESKLVISVRGCVYKDKNGIINPAKGIWLAERLRRDYHLEIEMAGDDYVLAILTLFDTEEGFCRLQTALMKIDALLEKKDDLRFNYKDKKSYPKPVMTLADAVDHEWEECILDDCAGRVSAEFVYLYPPGIPVVAPGELMSRDIIDEILYYKKMHLPVQGMADSDGNIIRVIK